MIQCPSCSEPAPAGALWCEACGSTMSATGPKPCVSCGSLEVSEDDYCMACGYKQPSERDHQYFSDGLVVAVSDRGRRHHHNEDAVAVGALSAGGVVIVVCDGVSSTPGSAVASMGAAIAARNVLITGVHQGSNTSEAVRTLLVDAGLAAQQKAAATAPGKRRTKADTAGPPSATLVACVALPALNGSVDIYAGWLGDSRAYWLDGEHSSLLTTDHAIEGSLSRWIGADAPDPVVETVHISANQGGRLLVCSDGLWRYADHPSDMAALVQRLQADRVEDLCEALVQFANDSGGHDNISVAIWPVDQIKNEALTSE